MSEYVVGIDLGTTTSCCSIFRNGSIEVIPTAKGAKTTPSIVHFKGKQRTVGADAKVLMVKSKEDYSNTVSCAKRLIGRSMNDPSIAKDLKVWPFKVVDQGGKPMITLPSLSAPIAVEQVSAAILSSLKADAERYLGEKVTKCVITVPAYFSNTQRHATAVAAKIAGLDVLRLVNEPTAAAYTWGLMQYKAGHGAKKLFIFDLGGGTFDVSVVAVDGGKFTVLATKGDSHLGGEDVDARLLLFIIKTLKEKHGVTLKPNDDRSQDALRKLRKEVEKFKHGFSQSGRVELFIDNVVANDAGEPVDIELEMTRQQFDKEICNALVAKALALVDPVLDLAKVKKEEINTCLLVGGSTRLPAVREGLKQYFAPEIIAGEVNPDEAVAQGAAICAGMLSKRPEQNPNSIQIDDVTSLPIGVKLSSGKLSVVIDKSQRLPCQIDDNFTNARDGQDKITFEIYEGEDLEVAVNNSHLGTLVFPLGKPYNSGEADVHATFNIDNNGIFHVKATDAVSKKVLESTIQYKATLSDDEINLLKEEEDYLTTVIPLKEKARRALEDAINCVNTVTENGTITTWELAQPDEKKVKEIIQATKDAEKWLKSGFNFYDKTITAEDYNKRIAPITKAAPDVYGELLDLFDAV